MAFNRKPLVGQLRAVLAHLVARDTITGLEALQDLGVYRLAAVIRKLRERNIRITTENAGDTRRFALYRLTDKREARRLLVEEPE